MHTVWEEMGQLRIGFVGMSRRIDPYQQCSCYKLSRKGIYHNYSPVITHHPHPFHLHIRIPFLSFFLTHIYPPLQIFDFSVTFLLHSSGLNHNNIISYYQPAMKASKPPLHICHLQCGGCSPCESTSPKRKVIFAVGYTMLTLLLAVAVYAATTITLHKEEIVPQNPSDLSCSTICLSDYTTQVDADRCCTSASAQSCKTKLQCKDWMLEHDNNYMIVAYAYIALFACIILVHLLICLRSRCKRDSQGQQREGQKVLRWRNKHRGDSLSDSLFEYEPKCQVCLKEVRPNKVVTLGCCKGLVHEKCLKGWMEEIDNCPSCGKLMEGMPVK